MALEEWKTLAEQGDTAAQNNLGLMYAQGGGVRRDGDEAAKWFRKAAEQGHREAQYNLGLMYYDGEAVPHDYVQAFMWFTLAAEQRLPRARQILKGIGKYMALDQIAEGEWLAREWKPKKP